MNEKNMNEKMDKVEVEIDDGNVHNGLKDLPPLVIDHDHENYIVYCEGLGKSVIVLKEILDIAVFEEL